MRRFGHAVRTVGFALFALLGGAAAAAGAEPYPRSKVVETIDWKVDTRIQHGPGSDQWPLTWADDDNL